MLEFSAEPSSCIKVGDKTVSVFDINTGNIDQATVESFGEEWSKFHDFSDKDLSVTGNEYFDIIPENVYKDKVVLDVGCGSGRWSKYISCYAKQIEAIDPSIAVISAASVLNECDNVRVSQASVDNLPFLDNSFDFVFTLGVLHHLPDTQSAIDKCVLKVKPGGYFFVYLYYALDNRNFLFRTLFWISNIIRMFVSKTPSTVKKIICDILAFTVYLPMISLSRLFLLCGFHKVAHSIPLSYYMNKSISIIRNDSLDRFGTPLEKRFTKEEIKKMMINSGLEDIVFSNSEPYWHVLGRRPD